MMLVKYSEKGFNNSYSIEGNDYQLTENETALIETNCRFTMLRFAINYFGGKGSAWAGLNNKF